MNKSFTIAKYEFLKKIKCREFFSMTFCFPLLTIFIIIAPILIMDPANNGNQSVGYIDQTNMFSATKMTKESQNVGGLEEKLYTTRFVKYTDNRTMLRDLNSGIISECIFFPSNYLKTGIVYYYTTGKMQSVSKDELSEVVITGILKDKIDENILIRVKNPVNMRKLEYNMSTEEFKESQFDFKNIILSILPAVLLIFSILNSSGSLIRSITEEKENKMIEILLSSVTHQELLVGKIVGLGAVGLLQIIIWVSIIVIGGAYYTAIYMNPYLLVIIFVYYILGYLLYASMTAGIGVISESVQEGQRIAGIITLVAILPLFLFQLLLTSPNSVTAVLLSTFPLTSAISMISRIAVTNVPFYQLLLSITILFVSIYLEIVLFSRLFRVEFLMYGKKPKINELIHYFFMK
jgi:ABC-type Na+ efflux pump, permease component